MNKCLLLLIFELMLQPVFAQPALKVYTNYSSAELVCDEAYDLAILLNLTPNPSLKERGTVAIKNNIIKKNFQLNGTLTLNDNLNLTDCNIKMGPGADIDLNGYVLTIDGTTISGCDEMWRGIHYLYTGSVVSGNAGASVIVKNNSLISDAENAIALLLDGSLQLSNSQFDNNYYDVSLWGNDAATIGSSITNCQFTCSNGFNLKPPHAAQRKNTALTLIAVKNLTVDASIFDECDYGINNQNSEVTVSSSSFSKHLTAIYGFNGISIPTFPTDRKLVINNGCNFNTCTNGIYVKDFDLNVVGNYVAGVNDDDNFDFVDYGITNLGMKGRTITVTNNKMHNTILGIYASSLSSGINNFTIADNYISTLNFPGNTLLLHAGIVLDGFKEKGKCFIKNNNVNTWGQRGIKVSNFIYPQIDQNTVNMMTITHCDNGIEINNCQSPSVTCNYSYGLWTSALAGLDRRVGYMFNQNYDGFNGTGNFLSPSYIENNSSNYLRYGFRFEHNAGKLTLLANHTGLHDYGFYLGSGGIGNQLAGNYDVDDIDDDSPSNLFDNSQIKDLGGTVAGLYTLYEYTPVGYVPTEMYPFQVLLNPNSTEFTSTLNCNDYAPPHIHDEEIVHEGEKIAGDTLLNETNDETYDWLSKLSLMKKLLMNSSLLDSSSILALFYDSTFFKSIGIIGRLDEKYSQLNDSTLRDTTERKIIINGMKESNDSIASIKLFEINTQLVNGVFINSLSENKDSLTDDDKEVIDFVAMQCPYIGGNAVYLARTIRCLYEKPIYYDDHCTAQMRQEQTKEDTICTIDFGVIPNPADGEVKFIYSENFTGIILVTDALGRTVKVLAPEKNSREIETTTARWAAGIYFIKFVGSTGVTELKKLVITH